METWGRVLALSVGGVAGVNGRYWLGVWISRWASSQFPLATFVINVSGAFAIGFLTALLSRWSPHSQLRLFLVVGFLGGYTTFSTFAFESVTLWQRGEWAISLAYMSGSVVSGCAAVVLGAALASAIVQPSWSRVHGMRQSSGPIGRVLPDDRPRSRPRAGPPEGRLDGESDAGDLALESWDPRP